MTASDASAALLVTPELWTSAAFDLRVLRTRRAGKLRAPGFCVPWPLTPLPMQRGFSFSNFGY